MYKKSSILLFFLICPGLLYAVGVPGTLDTTFNPTGSQPGTVATTFNNINAFYGFFTSFLSVVLQDDGKIVLAGTAYDSTNYYIGVGRFNTDGSLDTSFNVTGAQPGTLTLPLINGADSYCYAAAIQADGKIVVAGQGNDGTNNDFAVGRFNTDGSLDTSFNSAGTLSNVPGVVLTPINANTSQAYSVKIQSDGKIVAAGTQIATNTCAVVRYNTDGSLDTSFAGTGIVVVPLVNASANYGYSLAIQADGMIVVAGYAYNSGSREALAVMRFTSEGLLDTSFNASGAVSGIPGIVVTSISQADYSYAYAVAIQSDNKIVVAGIFYGGYGFTAARFNVDGSLDTTFNPNGNQPGTAQLFINNSAYNYSGAFALALQNDGKIVIAGYAYIPVVPPTIEYPAAVLRLNTNGTLDMTFNPGQVFSGTATTSINNWQQTVGTFGLAIQKNGAIIVGGVATPDGSNYSFSLARFNGVTTTDPYALSLISKYSSEL